MIINYIAIVFLVAVLDWSLGAGYSLWVLYSVPLGLATWNFGAKKSWYLLLLTSSLLFVVECIYGFEYFLNPQYLWRLASKIIALSVFFWIIGRLRKKEIERVIRLPVDQ